MGSRATRPIHRRGKHVERRDIALGDRDDAQSGRQRPEAASSGPEEAARQWQTTFDAIGDGICLLDGEGRIVRLNRALLELLGLVPGEILGRPPAPVLNEALGLLDVPGLLPAIEASRRRHSADLQSDERWYRVTVDPADDELGRPAGAVLIVSDITERKRLEEQGRLAERREVEAGQLRDHIRRMTELERLKTDFLNLASHELRGPLAVLRGYLTMLEDGSLGEPSSAMRAALGVMRGKVREMNVLVNQMLETARLEDSRLVLHLEDLDLREVLADARRAVEAQVGPGHRLQFRPGSRPVPVKGDRARLVTIVASLLDNALKYSPEGGRVTCTLRARDRLARISVADHGLGIPASEVPRLFTRFGRLLNAETRGIPGTGLGLYLAREMARRHGGEVRARSAPGRGSTFSVELPTSG